MPKVNINRNIINADTVVSIGDIITTKDTGYIITRYIEQPCSECSWDSEGIDCIGLLDISTGELIQTSIEAPAAIHDLGTSRYLINTAFEYLPRDMYTISITKDV